MNANSAIVSNPQGNSNLSSAVQAQSDELAMIKQKVQVLLDSKFLPDTITTWQQGVAIVLYGHELSIPDWMALKHISVIHGAPSIDGQLALALMERSGLLEEFTVVRSDNDICTLHIKRKGRAAFEHSCTRAEASEMKTFENKQSIPLTEKYNWKQQPKTMLFYFTVKQAGRRTFSDVLNGMAGLKSGDLSMMDIAEEAVVNELPGMPVQIGQTPNENPTSAQLEPQPDSESSAAFVELPDWWDAFNAWLKKTFEAVTPQMRDTALEFAPDWVSDKNIAKAAIIAAVMGYDANLIEQYTSSTSTIEVYDAAIEIAKRREMDGAA